MGSLAESIARFTEQTLNDLPRESELGTLNFAVEATKTRRILERAKALDAQDESQLSTALLRDTSNQLNELFACITAMQVFKLSDEMLRRFMLSLLSDLRTRESGLLRT
jgi:peroxiredoxin family protein